jgi:eukaryotic-like serine/threonine-protein kinase
MLVGQTLRNRYKILRELGSGAFGQTYLAEDLDLPGHPRCVVKCLKSHPKPRIQTISKRLFEREAAKLHELGQKCDRIPTLFAHFEDGGQFYLVQEWIEGQALNTEILPGKQFSEAYVQNLIQDLLEVLAVVHQHKVIHRDIKPQNLIRRSRDGHIVLIDFGAVKEVGNIDLDDRGETFLTVAIGTPGYMPNEQLQGKPQLCSDLYAVGILGIQALTGIVPRQLPEDARTGKLLWRDRVQVSPPFADFLDKLTGLPFDRPENASQALTVLNSSRSPQQPPQTQRTQTGSATYPPPTHLSQSTQTWLTQTGLSRLPISRRQFWRVLAGVGTSAIAVLAWDRLTRRTPRLSRQTFKVVTLDPRGQVTNLVQATAQVYRQDLGNGVEMEMVAIPGGQFSMGAPASEVRSQDSERPQHLVTVAPFLMSKYAVTQAQWREVAKLPKVKYDLNPDISYFKGDNRPVEQVSWFRAVEFCQRLFQFTGWEYRLPSEAEWEYACRAGTTTPFHFGETITVDVAQYANDTNAPNAQFREQTIEVGRFSPNAFGLYDMHGNVWEWCADDWHDTYRGAPSDGRSWQAQTETDGKKLLRGGSWDEEWPNCRSAVRDKNGPGFAYSRIGFRVACLSAPIEI